MRHIDHVVVAARDLDGAANLYARLGFQVGPRNRHPWGPRTGSSSSGSHSSN
ncbi:VOC family protein [Paracoccus aerius]